MNRQIKRKRSHQTDKSTNIQIKQFEKQKQITNKTNSLTKSPNP